MPRRIYGPERKEVTGGWKKERNEELCDLDSSAGYLINKGAVSMSCSRNERDEKCLQNSDMKTGK
jgi:hypothetical protein